MRSPPSAWKFVNRGLAVILSVFVLGTIASVIYLSSTLVKLDNLIGRSGTGISTTLLIQDLIIKLADAESAARGYVITGDQQFVTAFQATVKQIHQAVDALRGKPELQQNKAELGELSTLSNDHIDQSQQIMQLRTTLGEDAARALVANSQSMAQMGRVRNQTAKELTNNLGQIASRQQQSHDQVRLALTVAAALAAFTLGICAALIWYFRYSILRERALEGTKNEFLSLASHQLRTPATNVKQYVGLLLDGYLGELTDKQRDALKIAYKNNELEIRIMNDLLDVAKLDLKRIQLHKEAVNVVAIVRQAVKTMEPAAEERGQKLILQAPAQLVASVDRAYFRGVIEKLIDNAVRYSRDDSRIVIKIKVYEDRNKFEVMVRDKGLGIKKREIAKLFMKFSRITNEFSATSEGSGLGLYWVKQIMALHHGTVKVVSSEDKGSKFTVSSPIR